jgi:hypothetical protein
MMSKDPGQRYQSPTAVADALEPFTQTTIPLPPDSEMPQLSLAALPPPGTEGTPTGDPKSAHLTESQVFSTPRKQWQVSGSPSSTAPIVMPTVPARTAVPVPTVKPVAPVVRPTTVPEVRPIAPSHARVVQRPPRTANPPVVTPRKPVARQAPANNKPAPETDAPSPRTPSNRPVVRRPASKPATRTIAAPPAKRLRITRSMIAYASAGLLFLVILIIWVVAGR